MGGSGGWFERRTYTWTATDDDGDDVTFDIEVVSNLEEARERLAAVNRSILPELSRAMWGSVVDAVAGRLESPGPGVGRAGAAAAALKAQEGDDEAGLSWRDLVTGRTFAGGLGAGGGPGSGGSGGEGAGGGGSGGAVMWGSGDRRSLSLDAAALGWSGELFSAHVGVDAPLGESLRGGVGASWFESAIEYADRSGEAAVSGEHESRLASVHPYLGWTGDGGAPVVESRTGALAVGSGGCSVAFALGLSPAPLATFPVPALRTGRAEHPALQRDHALRTRKIWQCSQAGGLSAAGASPAFRLLFQPVAEPVHASTTPAFQPGSFASAASGISGM